MKTSILAATLAIAAILAAMALSTHTTYADSGNSGPSILVTIRVNKAFRPCQFKATAERSGNSTMLAGAGASRSGRLVVDWRTDQRVKVEALCVNPNSDGQAVNSYTYYGFINDARSGILATWH